MPGGRAGDCGYGERQLRVGGNVAEVKAKVGDRVKNGQVVLTWV